MTTQYQVLARKYRPKSFHELLGQTHVSTALANAIDTGRLHHAYLFTGTRGVGKTTIARILAKCLNCETGMTSQPCGACETCQAIDAGRFLDLIEIDAASRTKVEDTRDLLENVPYAPVQGRYKVYLIDEVHMLSTHSFNALLKTLEEPPEHVKFIFATTDPQKLPITIISRCLQFVLRPLPQTLLAEHLAAVLDKEGVQYHPSALWQLAHSARGSVRDALSLTDQAIAFGGGQIGDETVGQMLGLIDGADVLGLIADIYHDDRAAVGATIEALRAKMVDAALILDALTERLHQMALVQILPDVPLDMNDEDKKRLVALSAMIPAEVLQLYYEIVGKSKESLKFANTPMQGLEMAILRLLAFRPLAVGQMAEGLSFGQTAGSGGTHTVSADVAMSNDPSGQKTPPSPETPTMSVPSQPSNDGLDGANETPVAASSSALDEKVDSINANNAEHLTDNDKEAVWSNKESFEQKAPESSAIYIDIKSSTESDVKNSAQDSTEPESAYIKEQASLRVDITEDDPKTHATTGYVKESDVEDKPEEGQVVAEPLVAKADVADVGLFDTEVSSLRNASKTEANAAHAPSELAVSPAKTGGFDETVSSQGDVQGAGQRQGSVHDTGVYVNAQIDVHADRPETGHNTNEPARTNHITGGTASQPSNQSVNQSQSINQTTSQPVSHTQNLPAMPVHQMLAPPVCVLEGAWDDDKWDFWTHGAYAKGLLSADEFALVQNALIEGDIQGKARLKVSDVQYQIELSFKHLKEKIKSDLGTELSLDETPIDMHATPQRRQEARQEMALFSAKKALADSPVMQRLAAARVLAGVDRVSSLSQARLLL